MNKPPQINFLLFIETAEYHGGATAAGAVNLTLCGIPEGLHVQAFALERADAGNGGGSAGNRGDAGNAIVEWRRDGWISRRRTIRGQEAC